MRDEMLLHLAHESGARTFLTYRNIYICPENPELLPLCRWAWDLGWRLAEFLERTGK